MSFLNFGMGFGQGVRTPSDPTPPEPTIADILGTKLQLHLDMWNRPDLTVVNSGFISQITDAKAGVVFSQVTGSYMPATTNGEHKVPKGDGIDDTLETTDMSWCPSTGEEFCIFGVARNDRTAAGDPTVGGIFSMGNGVPNGLELRRVVQADRVLLAGSVGNGTAGNPIGTDYLTENFMGAITFRLEADVSETRLYVNNVLTGTLAFGPSLTRSRARLLASAVATANRFGASNVAGIVVSSKPTPEEIAAVEAIHSSIASQLAAA